MVARVPRRSSTSNAAMSAGYGGEAPQSIVMENQQRSTTTSSRMMMMRRNSIQNRGLPNASGHSTASSNTTYDEDDTTTGAFMSDNSSSEFTASSSNADKSPAPLQNRRSMLSRSKSMSLRSKKGSFRIQDTDTPTKDDQPKLAVPTTSNRRDLLNRSKSASCGSFRNLMKMGTSCKTSSGGGGDEKEKATSSSILSRRDLMKRNGSLRNLKRNCSFRNIMLGTGNDSSEKSVEKEAPPAKKEYLLDTLGGMAVLGSLVHDFEVRVLEDERLEPFFRGLDHRFLVAHQRRFFVMAFTEIGDPQVMAGTIRKAHAQLFYGGLSDLHFDMLVQHLVDSLKSRRFNAKIIERVTNTISPLRQVFEDEAEDFACQGGIADDESDTESSVKDSL